MPSSVTRTDLRAATDVRVRQNRHCPFWEEQIKTVVKCSRHCLCDDQLVLAYGRETWSTVWHIYTSITSQPRAGGTTSLQLPCDKPNKFPSLVSNFRLISIIEGKHMMNTWIRLYLCKMICLCNGWPHILGRFRWCQPNFKVMLCFLNIKEVNDGYYRCGILGTLARPGASKPNIHERMQPNSISANDKELTKW